MFGVGHISSRSSVMCENGMPVLDEDKAFSNVTFYRFPSFPRKQENLIEAKQGENSRCDSVLGVLHRKAPRKRTNMWHESAGFDNSAGATGAFLATPRSKLQFLLKFACKTKENVINPSRCSPLVLYLTSRRITPTYTVLAYVRGNIGENFRSAGR